MCCRPRGQMQNHRRTSLKKQAYAKGQEGERDVIFVPGKIVRSTEHGSHVVHCMHCRLADVRLDKPRFVCIAHSPVVITPFANPVVPEE
jgi:hypothetical protein